MWNILWLQMKFGECTLNIVRTNYFQTNVANNDAASENRERKRQRERQGEVCDGESAKMKEMNGQKKTADGGSVEGQYHKYYTFTQYECIRTTEIAQINRTKEDKSLYFSFMTNFFLHQRCCYLHFAYHLLLSYVFAATKEEKRSK